MGPATTAFRFHEEDYPLVRVEAVGRVDEPDFDAYLAFLTRLTQRPERRFLVLDFSQALPSMSARMREEQTAWNRKWEATTRERVLGLAFVAPQPLARVILRAVMLLQPPGCPWRTVASRAEAYAWAAQAFADAGDAATAQRARVLGAAAGR